MGHQTILQIASFLVFLIILSLSLRIILPWFGISPSRRWWIWLFRMTNLYLSLFGRNRLLKRGSFDFSPLAALSVLIIFQTYISHLSYYRVITIGIALAMVVRAAWQIAVLILLLLLMLCLVRLAGLLFDRKLGRPYWANIDALFRPLKRQGKRKARFQHSYALSLLFFAISLVILWLAGRWATGNLIKLLFRI